MINENSIHDKQNTDINQTETTNNTTKLKLNENTYSYKTLHKNLEQRPTIPAKNKLKLSIYGGNKQLFTAIENNKYMAKLLEQNFLEKLVLYFDVTEIEKEKLYIVLPYFLRNKAQNLYLN